MEDNRTQGQPISKVGGRMNHSSEEERSSRGTSGKRMD